MLEVQKVSSISHFHDLTSCVMCVVHGFTMKDALARLGSRFEELSLIGGESNYVRPLSLIYELDGKLMLNLGA